MSEQLVRSVTVVARPELRHLVDGAREVELIALVGSRAAFVRLLTEYGHRVSAGWVRDYALDFPPTPPYLDLEPGRLYVARHGAYRERPVLVPTELADA